MRGPICMEQQINDPFIQVIQETYLLNYVISLLSNHLYELLVDLIIGFRFVFLDFLVCVSLQYVSESIGKSYLSQNKRGKSDLSRGLHIHDDQRIGKRRVLKICHVFADSIAFKH